MTSYEGTHREPVAPFNWLRRYYPSLGLGLLGLIGFVVSWVR